MCNKAEPSQTLRIPLLFYVVYVCKKSDKLNHLVF